MRAAAKPLRNTFSLSQTLYVSSSQWATRWRQPVDVIGTRQSRFDTSQPRVSMNPAWARGDEATPHRTSPKSNPRSSSHSQPASHQSPAASVSGTQVGQLEISAGAQTIYGCVYNFRRRPQQPLPLFSFS